MLFGLERFGQIERFALVQRRQELLARLHVVLLLLVALIAALLVHAQEAVEDDGLARGAECVIRGLDVGADALELRSGHLRGNGAVPDQRVELELLVIENAGERRGRALHLGGTDRLMRLLRALALRLVRARLGQNVFAAVELLDRHLAVIERLLAEVHGVGTHVGDETHHALAAAEADAFVELLRNGHRLADGESEFAGALLLERRGGERRGRCALEFFLVDGRHTVRRAFQIREHVFHSGLGCQFYLLALLLGQ